MDEAARDALKRREAISRGSFQSAMTRVKPSVTSEIEATYRSIEQRGLSCEVTDVALACPLEVDATERNVAENAPSYNQYLTNGEAV